MNIIIKQFIIVSIIFIIVLWIQNNDDKKYNKVRNDYFNKYKVPLLMSSIIGLLLIQLTQGQECSLTVIQPNLSVFTKSDSVGKLNQSSITQTPKIDQQIFTDMPDF